jgi:hypothetical protein
MSGSASLACFKASRPDQRHPVKAGACRAPASRLATLTGCRRPRQGLAKQVRLAGKRNASSSRHGIRGRGFALPANAGLLETFWILAINGQKSPAASIFTLRYEGSNF